MGQVESGGTDTTPQADRLLFERFAAMSMAERALVMDDLNSMCTALAIAGIQRAEGQVSGDDLRWHLAARRYGTDLADEVYGPR